MTTVKKSLRSFTIFALIAMMILSIFAVPASAAGVETWYTASDYHFESPFTIRGYNLTPVKTMGNSGTLYLNIVADQLLDTGTYSTPMNFRYEVRSYPSGTILYSHTETLSSSDLPFSGALSLSVTAGQKIQIYTSAYDSVTGNYRTLQMYYGYWLN